jgi:hypothetical protein
MCPSRNAKKAISIETTQNSISRTYCILAKSRSITTLLEKPKSN